MFGVSVTFFSLKLVYRHDICQDVYTNRLWTDHILPVKKVTRNIFNLGQKWRIIIVPFL